jgi:hypothetical protein
MSFNKVIQHNQTKRSNTINLDSSQPLQKAQLSGCLQRVRDIQANPQTVCESAFAVKNKILIDYAPG